MKSWSYPYSCWFLKWVAEGRHQHLSDECPGLWHHLQCEVPPLHLLEGGVVHVDPVELFEGVLLQERLLTGIVLEVAMFVAKLATTFSNCLKDSSNFAYCALCPLTLGAHEPVFLEDGPVPVVDHVCEVVREVLDDHGVERDDVS